MNRKFYLLIFVLFVLLLSIKIFNIFSSTNITSTFSSYNGFEIDGSKIIKYNSSGGNLVIPSSINGVTITEIGDYAFENLNIDSIIIPNTVTSIGNYAFANNNITLLNIPDSVISIGEGAFIHNSLREINMNYDIELGNACFNDNYLGKEDAFFYKKGSKNTELISYGGKIKGNVEINNNKLTTIGEKAFLETYIISISIPETVSYIKKQAFRGNYLVELYLSNKINEIEEDAFCDNDYLMDIVIDKENNSILNYPWGAANSNLYWLKK